jgi:hypothetical protein
LFLRVIVQKAIRWNQITNKIHHIVIVGTVLNRIEKSYRDRGKIDTPNTHYVNGDLCKMLLRVAVYCYFFFFVQHMADAIHTTDQTGNNFYHVTQFHPITVNHICFRYISCHIDNKNSILKTFVYNNNRSY